jgi:hypothetical protein
MWKLMLAWAAMGFRRPDMGLAQLRGQALE